MLVLLGLDKSGLVESSFCAVRSIASRIADAVGEDGTPESVLFRKDYLKASCLNHLITTNPRSGTMSRGFKRHRCSISTGSGASGVSKSSCFTGKNFSIAAPKNCRGEIHRL